ncbi:MAG TPA: aminotransferase class I/II-fold pyridoxal phosphate-dependent enzyme [Gaiellaceae bacterium]|nr:aminotransferase class I/II-fold pyridoxal phosphate-dependent enzyme [Gaiellaceae bacterium]
MRALPASFRPYGWAMSTAEIAAIAGIAPEDVLRFDGNTPPAPPSYASAATVARALDEIQRYPHGGFPALLDAIADYARVDADQVVLGAGADDLILLCARSFAGPGDVVDVRDEPTYPLLRIAAGLAGAEVGPDGAVVTFVCRPHNPTGSLPRIPEVRPLVVDEAYQEYAGDTAIGLAGVVVIRTFSKAFGLAAARVGYAIADAETAGELRVRQDPLPITTMSAALALAALREPPDVSETIEERERLSARLREIGLDPLPSWTNFVYVPSDRPQAAYDRLLRAGLVVRPYPDAIRITVHTPDANDRLLAALEQGDR